MKAEVFDYCIPSSDRENTFTNYWFTLFYSWFGKLRNIGEKKKEQLKEGSKKRRTEIQERYGLIPFLCIHHYAFTLSSSVLRRKSSKTLASDLTAYRRLRNTWNVICLLCVEVDKSFFLFNTYQVMGVDK